MEAKRLYFIMTIIVHINCLFNDIKILLEEPVRGKNLHMHGRFNYVLQRGTKRVCVIEAKKDDMDQGIAQDLLGCDAVADLESSDCVLGIITNYFQWIFIRSLNDKILQDHSSLSTDGDKVDKVALACIAGKLYTLLSD